jgi:Uma2 family endonuclease
MPPSRREEADTELSVLFPFAPGLRKFQCLFPDGARIRPAGQRTAAKIGAEGEAMSRTIATTEPPMPSGMRLTLDDFERICARPENADKRLELVHGEVVEMSRPKRIHGILQINAGFYLKRYALKCTPPGEVMSESGLIIRDDPATVRGPDVAYYVRPPEDIGLRDWYRTPPLIAVEIRSPDNSNRDVKNKVDEYLAAGVGYVWTIDPDEEMLRVHRRGKNPVSYDLDDTLAVDEMPGFELSIAELFGKSQ